MKFLRRIGIALVAVALVSPGMASAPAYAVEPSEILSDPAMEARAREISKILRCLVCQNQSIDDSNADLARDLRVLVRERLVAGDSNEQAVAFIVDRYGDFVLLEPRVMPATYLLWFGPLVILLLAGFGLALAMRRRQAAPAPEPDPLTKEERARVDQILGDRAS